MHDRVRGDIERSDGRQLAATLRRDLVVPIVQLNHGMREAYPKVTIEREETMDMQALGEILPKLVPLGLPVGVDEVLTRLGLKRPDEKDDVLEAVAARGMPGDDEEDDDPPQRGGGNRGMMRALLRTLADDDAVDAAVAEAVGGWEPLLDPAIGPILDAARDHAAGGGSLKAFSEQLPGLFDSMDDTAVVRLLHRLGFSGGLSGREIPDDGGG